MRKYIKYYANLDSILFGVSLGFIVFGHWQACFCVLAVDLAYAWLAR